MHILFTRQIYFQGGKGVSREIKFRAWDKEKRQMEYIDDLYWFEENGVHDGGGEGFHTSYDLMQYTGLLDKNGKEIFEGDIVQSEFDGDLETVYFDEKTLQFNTTDRWLWMLRGRLEVIGNIHENPELLEAK